MGIPIVPNHCATHVEVVIVSLTYFSPLPSLPGFVLERFFARLCKHHVSNTSEGDSLRIIAARILLVQSNPLGCSQAEENFSLAEEDKAFLRRIGSAYASLQSCT